jgi:hypothetical protein
MIKKEEVYVASSEGMEAELSYNKSRKHLEIKIEGYFKAVLDVMKFENLYFMRQCLDELIARLAEPKEKDEDAI